MAYDLASLKTTQNTDPPRILIYGPPGLGKTTLAAEFPAPIIIDLEAGVPSGIEIPTFGEIEDFSAVLDAMRALYKDEHQFRTLIIDSLDRLEPIIWDQTCADNDWPSIEKAGYGQGYIAATDIWRKLIQGANALRKKRGMTIIMIAHSEVSRFDDPTSAPYSRYDLRVHKRASAMIQDEMDAILFVNQDIAVVETEVGFNKTQRHAEGAGIRWIYTEGRPAFTAKNRYRMAPRIKFAQGAGYTELARWLPAPKPVPASTEFTQTEAKEISNG